MAFMVSPGVNVSEVDLTAGARQISVSDAAFAGPFSWGPALDTFLISTEDELVKYFGKPTEDNYEYWFSAAAFLAYSNLLHVVRAVSDGALNATTAAKPLTGTLQANVGSAVWTKSATGGFDNGYGATLVIHPGQKVTLGGVDYTVNAIHNTASFSTTEVLPVVSNLAGTWILESGNTTVLGNSAITTAGLANSLVFLAGSATNTAYLFTVNAVLNSTAFTVTSAPNSTTANVAVSIKPMSVVNTAIAIYGYQINNETDYVTNAEDGSKSAFGAWAAKYPGEIGNSLKVSVCPSANAWTSQPAGSIALTAGNTQVIGTSTPSFDTELIVGDLIKVEGQTYKVQSITNSSHMVLETAATRTTAAPVASGSWSRYWEFSPYFDLAPGTSPYVAERGGSADELHICVVDEDGQITGTPGDILERYAFVSKAFDTKTPNGEANYYVTAINRKSKYIWWLSAPTTNTTNWGEDSTATFGADVLPSDLSLIGGQTDNANIDDGDLETAYDKFKSTDVTDISLIIAGPADATLATYLIQSIAEVRMDCVVLCSPEKSDVVTNDGSEVDDIISFRNTLPSSSYGFLDSGWKYTYDKYNDKYRWIPLNGDIAGLCARTDTSQDPWYSPAGFNRGNIKNVVKLAWNPDQLDRDELYKAGINPVVSFPQYGVILYGDKTLLTRPSAFDRLNVRRLFIILEKTIARLARTQLFEFNDEFTRSQFRNMVEPFLRDVKSRRGIYDYAVVCDETNNTAEVIEENRFVGDIYVKPARSINFIQLNFVAVRNGVSFQEVTGAL
jgi:hypothetical protein